MPKQLKLSLPFAVLTIGMLASSAHGQLFGSPPSRDVEEGAQVAKLVEQQIGLYSLAEAEAYLRKVGDRLVTVVNDPRWKFSFQIVDQAEPNAFSIPGGGVYVSRGLLALIEREDELACVLSHEIAHVTQRHAARQQHKGSYRTCSRCRET
jgi:predicted Zn-dependent protease